MKKLCMLFAMIACVLCFSGCSKTTKCKVDVSTSNYSVNSEYKVIHDGTYVQKVESVEVIKSTDEDVLDQFEELLATQLDPYRDLKYYDFEITKDKGTLTEKINIDYTKLDFDKLLEINSDISSMLSNKKIKYDTTISLYKQMGAKCE